MGKAVVKILLILLIPVFLFLLLNQLAVNSYDGRLCLSSSLEMSKKNDLFLGTFRALKDSVQLKNRKFKAADIWAEQRWTDGHQMIFFPKIYPEQGFNIIIPFTSDTSYWIEFMVKPNDRYANHLGGNKDFFAFSFDFPRDTITLLIEQPKNNSWEEPIIIDSVVYVKGDFKWKRF